MASELLDRNELLQALANESANKEGKTDSGTTTVPTSKINTQKQQESFRNELLSGSDLNRNSNAEGGSLATASVSSGYYSRPELWTKSESLYNKASEAQVVAKEKESACSSAASTLNEIDECLAFWTQHLQILQDRYQKATNQQNGDMLTKAQDQMKQIMTQFLQAQNSYDTAYAEYTSACQKYNDAANAYNGYIENQQKQFDTWKATIRDSATVKQEIDSIDAQISELKKDDAISNFKAFTSNTTAGMATTNSGLSPVSVDLGNDKSAQIRKLEEMMALLQEEYDWSQYYKYADLMDAEDFSEKSKYVSTANGKERSAIDIMMGNYSTESSGWEDPLYEYINGNEEAGAYISNAAASSYGSDNAIGAIFGRSTEGKTESQQMTEDEIATFNYLYATQGKEAAHDYYDYLLSDLNYRQRKADEEYWSNYAAKDPIGSSVFSLAISPAKGLSYLGQTADYVSDGTIDQNAAYNKFSYIPSTIREKVPENWGPVGSFAYQTGMSMADFLLSTAITGGNQAAALAIMGTGAAADATISAKDRGLSDSQSFALGTIAGLAEVITEKVSLETLLNPDLLKNGAGKYILKNMLAEGSEEVGSDLINLFADIIVSKDQSEWQKSIDAYVADGKTEEEAFGLAIADQAVTMGLDFLGGAISGGLMGGGGAIAFNNNTKKLGSELGELDLDKDDIQEFINTGLESDPKTASYQLAMEMQAKIEAGETLSNYDLSRLYQANVQAVQAEKESTEDLPDDAVVSDDQTDAVAGDVTDQGGLSLPSVENDTRAPGFVTQNAQNGTQTQVNDTALPAGVPLSIADQLRQEQAQNGGIQYESTYERAAGPAAAQPAGELYVPGRTGLSDGGTERNAGTGTAEQAGVLANSAEQRRSAWTDRSRATVARQNYARSLRLEKVSSLDLGLQNGTEARNIQVMPQEHWDAEMSQLADRIYNETGKGVTYVMGRIQIRGSDGTVGYARGVITGDRIIIQADHLRIPMEQIADHEAYHAKVDFAAENKLDLNARIKQHILDTFSAEQFQRVLDKYIVGLRGVIDVNEARTGEEFEAAVRQIEEEIFADAYAGINAFGANADQFTGAVNEKMDQLYMGKIRNQENGTEEPTGPHDNRYSTDDENSSVKQQMADNQDVLNAMDPVARISVPHSFLQLDKAGKQNWIVEKLRPTGYKVDRRGFGIIDFAKKRLKSAFNYFRKGSAEEAVFEALPRVLEKGIEISTHADHKGREYGTVTIAAPITVNGKRGNMAVVVKQTTANFYKVHRILSPDGSAFLLLESEEAEPTSGGGVTQKDPLATPIGSASATTIQKMSGNVKERFSYAGENANNADLDALARAKEMQAAGVADETIRQQTGWHTGMDGKWRWEIDDSKMQYTSRGDLGLRERRPEYARYRELLDKSNRYALELSDEALTPEETAELQKLKDIWGGTFRKAGRITEDALPADLLSDYVKHDDLFEAYPQLHKTRLRFADLPEGTRGQYDPEQDVITLSESLRGKPQDTLIHEIQHVIQKAEGFAQGSSPEFWDGQQVVPPEYASEIQKAEDTVKKVEAEFHQEWPDDINLNLVKQYIELDNQLWGDGTDPIALQELADQMDQIEQLATESGWGDLFNDYYYAVGQLQMAKERAKLHRRAPIDLYRNTAGEIEARDAASRRRLTAEQRRSAEPARADDRTVFVEDIDGTAFAELDAQYGPQLQSAAELDQDTISGNIQQVAQMEPVTSISGQEFAKGEVDLITQVETFFNQRGNRAYSPELGEVILDRKGVKSDIGHGIGRKKAAAFAAVPDVIEHGLVVDHQKDWKGRGYDTAVVAAPITTGDQTNVAAVILLRSDQTNRFYVHEVLAMENGALPFKTGTREGYPGGDAPSILSILERIRSVKNETGSQERYSVDDAESQQVQEQKPAAAPKKKIRPVAESRPLIAKKDLRNTVLNLFSIPNGQRAEVGAMINSYADRLIKNGTLTEEDRKAFFDRMYDAGVMVMPAEEYSAFARSHIVDGRIYVSDSVKSDFGDDWADIRRRAFAAGVYLVNDRSASGIDQWNATLSAEDMLPGLFDSEETDERTILERILQVAEEGKDEHLSLAEYTRRLSQQEGISEDEFLDNMERQLDWALRTFAEKARLEVHLRDRTGRKIAQEREKGTERMTRQQAKEAQRRADERQARKDSARRAKERREMRELQQRTLKQLQWLSRNRNRAPEELRSTWDEVLGDIDLYAISAADEMRWSDKHNATWKDLAQMYKDAMKNDPNFLPSKELERIVARLDATKIADMDLGALQDLYKAAIGLRTEFYNRNNVINDEMQRLFAEVYTDAKREIESAPGGFTGGVTDKFLNLDQLTPMNVLQRMAGWDPDSSFYSMAKQLEHGERDMRAYSVKAQKMLQDFLTEHEDWVKKADGQGKDAIWYEVEVPQLLELGMGDKPIFGPTVKVYMTPAQKVHMFLESKNLDNLRHMTGGRTFVDKELYSQGKRQEALSQGRTIRLAPETVRKLVSDLTPEEMELAQILDRYYNTFATQEINKVSNILYGYDKAMGKNYAPIYTNRNYTKTEFGVFDTTAEGVGNLKGRQYAVNPSYNISAFDAFERHVDQTARFVGMAIPARNWTTLMNWREKNNSTGDVITHKWGEESKRYITDLITTLQGGDDAKSDTVSSGLSKLQSNYISAIFGANPSIVLKQLGSIPLAGAYLDARNIPTPAQISKIDRSLISKYTQELEWRTMGYTTPETKQLKDNPNWTQTNKAFKFVFGGGAITAMDGWAASTLWPWAENKVRREHPELAVGTKAQVDAGESAFYKKVAEEFEIAVSRSQSVSDEIHQGSLRKSKNPITRAFTMFRSDSAQTYNTLRQKIGEARYYMRTGAKDKVIRTAKKAAGTAFVAMLLNAAWSEAVNFLMALWKNKGKYYRDDEDELTFESVAGEMASSMLGSFAGVVTGGEELFELIGNIITGDTWYGIETPGMEQLNDLLDTLIESGSGMRDLVADGWDILKNGGDLGEYFSKHSGQILGSIKDLAEAAAMYLPGLPTSNLEAYLVGALKWISPELGAVYDDLFSDVGKSDLAGMEGGALESRIGGILSDRNVSESDDTAAALAALYEAGYKTAIPSDTPTSISINGENQTLGAYQQQAYDTIWGGIVADALDDIVASDSFAEADPKTQAKMLSNLYTYAAEQAKAELFDEYEMDSGAAKNAAIVAAGATVAECITWNTITSEMKSGEKSAELASWDIPESAKREIFLNKISDSREDSITAFLDAGLSFDQFLQAYSKYGEINNMDLKAGMKAVEFSHWVNDQGYSAEQATVVKDELTYFNMTPATSSRYDELVGSGMDPDDAYDLTGALNELQPEDGEDEVSDLQKWRASVDFSDDVDDQLAALSAVMTDAQFQKVEIANDFGVSPDAYVTLQEIKPQYDADGNGSYKQKEIQAAIDGMPGYYTTEQKAVLWQLATGSTSSRNNPYSRQVGQQVLDARAAAKEAAAQEQTEAPTDSADDDSFSQALLDQLLGRG